MASILFSVVFLNPWYFLALLGLPILYFLLRITPPQPQIIDFAPTRFLLGLVSDTITPSKTPLWLLLLRMLIVVLTILALAHPIYNPSQSIQGQGSLVLVVDNGWEAAQNWPKIRQRAVDIAQQAQRDNRPMYILNTADQVLKNNTQLQGRLLTGAEGLSLIKTIKPQPWGSDYDALNENVKAGLFNNVGLFVVLSSGIGGRAFDKFITNIANYGDVKLVTPQDISLPLLLLDPARSGDKFNIQVQAPAITVNGAHVTIQAHDKNGAVIDQQRIELKAQITDYEVFFDIVPAQYNAVSYFSISGRKGAGARYVLDNSFQRKSVGIISAAKDVEDAPLIDNSYYIRRALQPFVQMHVGTYDEILSVDPSVIILPDIGAIPTETLNKLDQWVKDGGVLLRFAGENLSNDLSKPVLMPVPLRSGGRSVSGKLSWDKPLKIAPFVQTSPFYGLKIPEDVTVKRQILAQPSEELAQKSWANLEDGTPLITKSNLGDGLLVLVHTTATPEWSDLALSGLFVDVLRRIVDLSGKAISHEASHNMSVLEPLIVLDGLGMLIKPPTHVKSIEMAKFSDVSIGPDVPPGIYGGGAVQHALNIGDRVQNLPKIGALPLNVIQDRYESGYELDLKPYFLWGALTLLLLDWFLMLFVFSNLFSTLHRKIAKISICLLSMMYAGTTPALATDIGASISSTHQDYSSGLYLAYIKTGDLRVDNTAKQGLEVLAKVLKRRTSVEPDGVAALDPEKDVLGFFPLIYWPVTANAKPLSAMSVQNVQYYLDNGGTILFDTRDQNYASRGLGGSLNANALRQMIAGLSIPPLETIPEKHVLGKSFYLLSSYPGRYNGGTLWIEKNTQSGRDGVSSVIIGSHDWASSWADAESKRRNIRGSSRQQELSLRFGVNLMMYALTGNYKADQVHLPFILERLGQ